MPPTWRRWQWSGRCARGSGGFVVSSCFLRDGVEKNCQRNRRMVDERLSVVFQQVFMRQQLAFAQPQNRWTVCRLHAAPCRASVAMGIALLGARATRTSPWCFLVPEAMRIGLGCLPDDGQRHLRPGAGRADAAVHLTIGIVLAAVLDLEVQPHAPAFAGHLAAVGFAGQVHPDAGAVLEPVAVGAERLVYVQAEALGAAALGQRYLE